MPKRAREEPCAICGHWHDVSSSWSPVLLLDCGSQGDDMTFLLMCSTKLESHALCAVTPLPEPMTLPTETVRFLLRFCQDSYTWGVMTTLRDLSS